MTKEEVRETVFLRVIWWLQDLSLKPPEILTPHYFDCMAKDIAATAVGEYGPAMERLDP